MKILAASLFLLALACFAYSGWIVLGVILRYYSPVGCFAAVTWSLLGLANLYTSGVLFRRIKAHNGDS